MLKRTGMITQGNKSGVCFWHIQKKKLTKLDSILVCNPKVSVVFCPILCEERWDKKSKKNGLILTISGSLWAITGKQYWRCGMIRKHDFSAWLLVNTQNPKRMSPARDSRTVATKVGIRSGMCNNSPAKAGDSENWWCQNQCDQKIKTTTLLISCHHSDMHG